MDTFPAPLWRPPLRSVAAALLAAAAVLGTPHPGASQVVRGTVAEEGTGTPVQGAMVVLLDSSGVLVRRVLTDAAGGFIARAAGAGAHRIRVDRIGYESLTTPPFQVPEEGTFQRVAVPIRPVELEGLEVEGARRCQVRGDQGPATARAWDEARKALEAAAWTLESGTYRYTLMRVQRTLDADGRTTLREDRRFDRGSFRTPYVSVPAQELVERGFVRQESDGSLTYLAPDAESFLSDAFLDTHCMSLAAVRDGAVALAFEPIRGRYLPDIRGTLWLDAATATLRRLEFNYVNLPAGLEAGDGGGEVIFARLPNGTWIVREWAIRMPLLATSPDRTRMRVTGYEVQGGVVWRVTDSSGTIVLEGRTASVTGTVADSVGAAPQPPASVAANPGTSPALTQATDAQGSFLLSGLPPGLQTLEVRHPSLDTLGLGPVVARVEAAAGELASVAVRIPSVAEVLAETCGGGPPAAPGSAVLLVQVRRQGAPAGGERVRVRWLGDDRRGRDIPSRAAPPRHATADVRWREDPDDPRWIGTLLDQRGIFVLCGIPAPSRVRVEVGGEPPRLATVVELRSGVPVHALTLTLPDPTVP